jgi:hypothetical protein
MKKKKEERKKKKKLQLAKEKEERKLIREEKKLQLVKEKEERKLIRQHQKLPIINKKIENLRKRYGLLFDDKINKFISERVKKMNIKNRTEFNISSLKLNCYLKIKE